MLKFYDYKDKKVNQIIRLSANFFFVDSVNLNSTKYITFGNIK
ncbi:hypothetical protein CLV62_12449 [Dysgonomonas alginatilytica]|uniref:Uncharacterized protein n=1 Tax=Dysgonomonas alginatilytica TaxID=1605892 RepID=A0A2V3PKF5_9BACT|nr:hypothetical protein CLV62_12449 [Dysgonomonas alginatilytica]